MKHYKTIEKIKATLLQNLRDRVPLDPQEWLFDPQSGNLFNRSKLLLRIQINGDDAELFYGRHVVGGLPAPKLEGVEALPPPDEELELLAELEA